ncbi:hypothetical protein IE81DRAFT_327170 [Ceraceosorus guamensis]|uniref:Uncharacterized protein n=1 Tax=Ceraceosorus guamensis TaxID=1522189 RepID=A0A316VRF5_9BASI|nr:hypothetical protein IE81DRAFT_327170 [Ceraceosorus guamensis]PWN38761.1 hypothetical protein IE81DRAFT_327170 [Ceraceosorus guamensis]
MTYADTLPKNPGEAAQDRHSHSLPGGQSGPNKAGNTAPSGAAILGTEIGGQADARRERAQAIKEGDVLPPGTEAHANAGQLGFGGYSGADAGVQEPSRGERQQLQQERNEEWKGSDAPDLGAIARSSAASGAHNAANRSAEGDFTMSGNRRQDELLDTVGRSIGTESGTGAHDGSITRDAGTGRIADP